jgi:hypothetical protein
LSPDKGGFRGSPPNKEKIAKESRGNLRKLERARENPGVWGLAPMKNITGQIEYIKFTKQAPISRVYITRSLVNLI